MATLNDLRLRFWITLARRIIYVIDGAVLLNSRLGGRTPSDSIHPTHPLCPKPIAIPVSHGYLDARLLIPSDPLASILICHGIGDRLSYWKSVQVQLAVFGITSLLFDYAGYGKSTGSISVQSLREDTQAAYAHLRSVTPGLPVFLLGFSMGTGVAGDAVTHLSPPPAGLILCQAFTSLRAAAAEVTRSELLARLIPDVWNSAVTLPSLSVPLLIVHGDADCLFPLHHAHTLHAAAGPATSTLAIPPGFSHPGAYLNPTQTYWGPILRFIKQHMH